LHASFLIHNRRQQGQQGQGQGQSSLTSTTIRTQQHSSSSTAAGPSLSVPPSTSQTQFLLLRALSVANPTLDFTNPLPSLWSLPRIPATSPPTSILYIAFETDVFPNVVFRVDSAVIGIGIGTVETEETEPAGAEFEFESEPGSRVPSRAASICGEAGEEVIGSRTASRSVSVMSSGEATSASLPTQSRSPVPSIPGSTDPISLFHLALFIQRTLHAPLPPSAQRLLLLQHPHLPLPSTSSPQNKLRIIDVLGPRTKFGGLVPLASTWKSRQVWTVLLIAS